MKHYLKLLLPLLFISCYSVERNCEDFHEGSFEFSQIINGEMTRSRFERDANFEIEFFEGVTDTASIRWVNDCECILTKLNPTSNQDKRPIQIKILSTTNNSYTFEYSLVGDSGNTQRGTIQKIK
ncbi:hypothetical protein N9877_03175 [Flavobacteriaceae bacterium]|nr:hypothetical protein [Flavobacteriaceae bacterium]MDB4269922.1 hypothetical protein [Flavobacteriaceae bacterium]MDG1141113.1 hypothetical protein [Flavobacteriaceae bacterium]MDG1341908.1 hypothetical protein [Flavobacteriaceae bacterium]